MNGQRWTGWSKRLVSSICERHSLNVSTNAHPRQLFEYLRPNCAVYHVRAVNLVWSLEASTSHPHAESIIAQSMASPESRNAHDAYEAFGVLWRLTGQITGRLVNPPTEYIGRGQQPPWLPVQGPDDDCPGYIEE
jgi:hypothetical protein